MPNFERANIKLNKAIDRAFDCIEIKDLGYEDLIPYVVGPPGGGKTQMILEKVIKHNKEMLNKYGEEECKQHQIALLTYTPGLERPEKFSGIPDFVWKSIDGIDELHTEWSIPSLVVDARVAAQTYGKVLIFFDDWHLCSSYIQQTGFELFTHYSLNGHKLPKNTYFILAGNEGSAAGAEEQLSAIRNRSKMFFTVADPDYWVKNYAIVNDFHPIAYSIFKKPENLVLFHEEESVREQWASPRSWAAAFNNIKFYENKNITDIELHAILQGCIGVKAAAQLFAEYKLFYKFNVEKIFKTGEFTIPTNPLDLYTFGAAISSQFYAICCKYYPKRRSNKSQEVLQHVSKILCDIVTELQTKSPEIVIVILTTITMRSKDSKNHIDGFDLMAYLDEMGYIHQEVTNTAYENMQEIRSYES